MGVPLYAICYFSPGAFNILSFCLIVISLITMCLSYLGLFVFLDLVDYFLFHVGEIFSYYVFKYFLRSFLSSPSGTPYDVNVGAFKVVPEVSQAVFLFILFSTFYFLAVTSIILSSRSFIHSSVSAILLLIPSSVLFICLFVLLGPQ